MAGALLPCPERAGAASSLLGFVTAERRRRPSAPSSATPLGLTAWPLAIAMMVAGGLSLLLWTLSRNVHGGPSHR